MDLDKAKKNYDSSQPTPVCGSRRVGPLFPRALRIRNRKPVSLMGKQDFVLSSSPTYNNDKKALPYSKESPELKKKEI